MREKLSINKIMVVFMFALWMFATAIPVHAATPISTLKQQYPSNSTWNGSYHNRAWQCHGFACMIAEKLTDTDPYTWKRSTNLNSVKAGDIIRFNRPHTILVTSVSGDTITYVDCNWVASNTIKWDQTIKKSKLTSKFGSLDRVWVSPTNICSDNSSSNNNTNITGNTIPVFQSVRINYIDHEHLNFSLNVSNATLVKIHIESVLTGEKKVITYKSGLSNINYTFSRYTIPTGGNQYRIYLYAYNGSSGNYQNEQIHRMLYGSTPNTVTFPNTLSNNQIKKLVFNSKLYADLYPDVKNAYGYDENKLWMHFLKYGIRENRATGVFWPSYYLKNNQDVRDAYGVTNYARAFYHFTTYGYKEGRTSSPVFTAPFYLNANPDIANAYGSRNYYQAAVHFNTYGIYEYRNSSPYYAGGWYKHKYRDLYNLNMSSYDLIRHYITYGIREGRYANSTYKRPTI